MINPFNPGFGNISPSCIKRPAMQLIGLIKPISCSKDFAQSSSMVRVAVVKPFF